MSKKPNEAQQKVLDARGNILVNASAGSGKTSIMVDKIIQLLCDGIDIRKILVMTFTVAAASEMKVKLIKKIYGEIRENNSKSAILMHQLNNIPFGNICTIDSFCYGIFQKYFAIIKRDPSCIMMEPTVAQLNLNEIIDSVCEEYVTNNDEGFLILARHFSQSRKLDELKKTIITLTNFLNSQSDIEDFKERVLQNEENASKEIINYFKKYFNRQVETLIGSTYNYMRSILSEKMLVEYEHTEEILAQLECVKNTKDLVKAIETLILVCQSSYVEKGNSLEIKDIIKSYYALLSDYRKEFSNYYDLLKTQSTYCTGESKKLIEVVLKVRESYLAYKEKRNLVDFGDLKYYALKILNNDIAKEEIREGFDYIFVDEYQDTDNLQEAILKAICKDNNVFVVGDIKQAIYRFRYAEPKIFNGRMKEYDSLHNGQNIPLSVNYRSDKRILDFVNQICNEIMTTDFCGIDYKKDGQLSAGKDFAKVSDEPPCSIYTYVADSEKAKKAGYYSVKKDKAEEETQIEGAFIANKIKQLITSVNISDGEGNIKRVEYKDIAILVGKRSILKRILGELDAEDIPYNLDDDTIEKDEDREVLIDFIRILTNMAQDIPLANVLTSKMYNFELSELLRIQKENPKKTFWEAFMTYSADQNLKIKIDAFLSDLEIYRFKASYMKVSDLLIEAMGKGFDGYLLSKGKRAIEKINAFIHFISGKDADNSIEDFIYFYENTYNGNKITYVNNAVIISTIHKSKGLEYPVVFLAGADAKSVGGGNQNQTKVFSDKDLGIAIKNFDDEKYVACDTFATSVFKLKTMQEERQEMARLLYVALTRACNHIYITGKVAKEEKIKDLFKANSFMDMLIYVKQNNGAFASNWNELEVKEEENILLQNKINTVQEEINLDCLGSEYPFKTGTLSPAKYSVSQLLHDENSDVKKLFEASDISTGISYHTVMQYIDYNATDIEKIKTELSRMVEKKIIDQKTADGLDLSLLKSILNSDIMNIARTSETYREQPFMLYTDCVDGKNKMKDKALVQGVIDLLIFGENVILVDFKASLGSPEYLKSKYSRQLEIYAEAVEKIFKDKVKNKVVKKVLFNILKNYVVEL